MNGPLRVSLIVFSILILLFVLRRIRKSRLEIEDSIYWMLVAVALIVVAIVPRVAYFISSLLGFESPSNFIFACGIIVLLVRTFKQDQKICELKKKLTRIAQREALRDK